MPPEIVTAAAGLLGKMAAEPAKAAAMRRAAVINALKKLRLDPSQPPKDFESLYAYALVEELYGRPRPILLLFQDQYVQRAFARSFDTGDWSHIRLEVNLAVERNNESGEFGHLGVDVDETLDQFINKFQDLVSRSRDAHGTRLEQKVDALLDQVMKTRNAEEAHRLVEEPERAGARPDERLSDDVRAWFIAVGYKVERTWASSANTSAILVNVPTRRPGRFDRVVALCVDGELGLYHLDVLERLVQEEGAAEGWGVAQLRISEAARRRASDSEDRYSCFSFDELIDLEVDFEPYIDWLQNEVKTRSIDTRYIPLSCKKEEVDPGTGKPLDVSNYHWGSGGLDRYVETWLTDPAKKHLSLLGEFGMGKSWFSLHFASELAEAWKDAKKRGVPRPRVPLVIPLRDYAKQTSVSALLSEFFFNKHKIGLRSYDAFSVLNRMGRLLLIFDGFDEMASRIDRNTMVANFWELAKAVEPGAKVLLSSRTEHFPEAKHARDLFEARISTSASAIPTDGPTFEIVELVPFDDVQIERMLGNLLGPDKVESVMNNDDVRDLMRRPVMSELVMDALPAIEGGAPVNLTRIYLYAVQRKMDKDVNSQRTFTSRADKMFFLSEVSWEMLRTNQLTLNYRDFPDKLRACFGPVVESSKDLDYWEQDMRNQGMFVRNSEGDYGPSHKSLLEFLTAYKYAAELGLLAGDFLALIPNSGDPNAESYSWLEYFNARSTDGSLPSIRSIRAESAENLSGSFGSDEFNPVVYDFLTTMAREHSRFEEVLIGHIRSTKDLDSPAALGGNCANLIGHAQGTLEGTDLEGVDLTGFRHVDRRSKTLRSAEPRLLSSQPNMSLRGTSLRRSVLNSVSLAKIDKRDAIFNGANLKNSDFLVSSRRVHRGNFHPRGKIGALVVDDSSPLKICTILRWWNDDLKSTPEEIQLHCPPDEESGNWGAGARYFLGTTEDWWGYSDGANTFIISTDTGETLDQIIGCASRAITWGDREALVCATDEMGARWGWKIVDLRTHDLLAEASDVEVEGATHFVYFEHDFGMRVWARGSEVTKILHFGSAQPDWVEVGTLPAGRDHSLSQTPHLGHVMNSGGLFYFADHVGECITFEAHEAEPVRALLTECEGYTFTREADHVAIFAGRKLSIWRTGPGVWAEVWSAKFSTDVNEISLSLDESRLLVACRAGEVFLYSFLQGELISDVSLNPHLIGATFSGSSELSNEEVMSIRRAGAAVVGETEASE
ncbi:NACHT domain-containing protein [Streptomyces sp. NBC_01615]|uniref:NACHT domain-containing protein n=1 Tax=Streptomyces sp. NBC_01615 TaxID=2975898 RepID=UPI0038694063